MSARKTTLVETLAAGLPAEETVGVEARAGGREDVQEGVDGGGRIAQVQNNVSKFLEWEEMNGLILNGQKHARLGVLDSLVFKL